MSMPHETSFFYSLPDFGEIEIPPFVLEHFAKHQQVRCWHKEAGGQLFWEHMANGKKRLGAITGPRPSDRRTRTSYKAAPNVEQLEIDSHYDRGLFFLGDWHTHPEPIARPSADDRKAIQEIYSSSTAPGPGFLLVVVGTRPLEESLSVSWCNHNSSTIVRRK